MSAVTSPLAYGASLPAPPTATERMLLALAREVERWALRRMQRRRLDALRLADRTAPDPVEQRRRYAADAYRRAGMR